MIVCAGANGVIQCTDAKAAKCSNVFRNLFRNVRSLDYHSSFGITTPLCGEVPPHKASVMGDFGDHQYHYRHRYCNSIHHYIYHYWSMPIWDAFNDPLPRTIQIWYGLRMIKSLNFLPHTLKRHSTSRLLWDDDPGSILIVCASANKKSINFLYLFTMM